MTLPASWKLVRVYGAYLRSDGLPNVGSVWFDSASPVIIAGDGGSPVLVVPKRQEFPLDADGTFEAYLPATDDPDINPVGWTYQVREQMPGGREFSIDIPVAMDAIDLITWAQATPIPTPPPTVSYLTTTDIGVNVASQTDMDAAVEQSAQAATDAATAVGTANSANATALAAQATAVAIDGKAQTALDTANASSAAAAAATTTANAAAATANAIAGTANTALANSAAAVSTANGIDAKATSALSTANAASVTAGNAVTTANAASGTAGTALSTANAANATANGIDAKATQAQTDAATAIANAAAANTNANGRQPADATLTGIAALTVAINKVLYTTGTDTFAAADLTAFARTLLDDADATTMRATLGLAGGAVLNVGQGANTLAAGNDSRFNLGSFKNKLINGKLDFWQRGTSFSYTNANTNAFTYTADRYLAQAYSGPTGTGSNTITMTQQAFAAGQTAVPGNPTYFGRLQASALGPVAPLGFIRLQQPIEDVRTCAGSTVTISMWLKADSARTIMIGVIQNLGSGGSSPTYSGALVNVTTAWARYSVTLVLPSLAGKTIGANSHLDIGPYLHCTDTGFPVQTPNNWSTAAYLDFCEMQCEEGPVATDFEQRPPGIELSLCQRYFCKSFDVNVTPALGLNSAQVTGIAYSTNIVRVSRSFPVPMRTPPGINYYSDVSGGLAGQVNIYNTATTSWNAAYTSNVIIFTTGFQIDAAVPSALGGAYMTRFNWTADSEF